MSQQNWTSQQSNSNNNLSTCIAFKKLVTCPLTNNIFYYPVTCIKGGKNNGIVYEREAIKSKLSMSSKSDLDSYDVDDETFEISLNNNIDIKKVVIYKENTMMNELVELYYKYNKKDQFDNTYYANTDYIHSRIVERKFDELFNYNTFDITMLYNCVNGLQTEYANMLEMFFKTYKDYHTLIHVIKNRVVMSKKMMNILCRYILTLCNSYDIRRLVINYAIKLEDLMKCDEFFLKLDNINMMVYRMSRDEITEYVITNFKKICKLSPRIEIIIKLLDYVDDVTDPRTNLFLNNACKYCDTDVIKYMLQKKFNTLTEDKYNNTPYHIVCMYGDNEAINLFIDMAKTIIKEDVFNTKNIFNCTPLYCYVLPVIRKKPILINTLNKLINLTRDLGDPIKMPAYNIKSSFANEMQKQMNRNFLHLICMQFLLNKINSDTLIEIFDNLEHLENLFFITTTDNDYTPLHFMCRYGNNSTIITYMISFYKTLGLEINDFDTSLAIKCLEENNTMYIASNRAMMIEQFLIK